jgi:hypothetical protein
MSKMKISGLKIVAIAIAVCSLVSSAYAEESAADTYGAMLGTWDLVTEAPTGPVTTVITCSIEGDELVIIVATVGPAGEVAFSDGALSFAFDVDGLRHNVMADVTGDNLEGNVFVGGTSFCNYDDMYELTGTRRTSDF